MTTLEAISSSLDDAATIIGQQRQTISELREALRDALGYVEHWQRDVEGNLKPTLGSLSDAHGEIVFAILKSTGAGK